MREKPANEYAVTRLIQFLNQLKFEAKGTPGIISNEYYFQRNHGVAKRTFSDCRSLGIIKKEDKKTVWLKGEVTRKMALEILDYRLTKTKKTIHYPLPGLAAIGDSLKEISDRLAHIMVQQERLLKTPKIDTITNEQADLFRVDDQRLYIAGQIASVIYQDVHNIHNDEFEARIHSRNQKIILATDDLIKKLLNQNDKGNSISTD